MTLALECEEHSVWYIHIYTENWHLNLYWYLTYGTGITYTSYILSSTTMPNQNYNFFYPYLQTSNQP